MACILIVDDSKIVRVILKTKLYLQGHQVFSANDGEEGL